MFFPDGRFFITVGKPSAWQSGSPVSATFASSSQVCQVPSRLKWKEDLHKLTPFNRKLMWVHGGFAVLTIVAFGILTLALHEELLRGDRAALGLALFIGVYWALRIVVDFTYYEHTDWPRGQGFVVGHVLLNLLFTFLAVTNLAVFVSAILAGRGK